MPTINKFAVLRKRIRLRPLLGILMICLVFLAVGKLSIQRQPALTTAELNEAAVAAQQSLGYKPKVVIPNGWEVVVPPTLRQEARGVMAWTLTYRTSQGNFVGLTQSDGLPDGWRTSVIVSGQPQGTVQIGDVEWSKWYNPAREATALTSSQPHRATVVTAKFGGIEEATQLARSWEAA